MANLRYCNGTESRKQLIRLAGSEPLWLSGLEQLDRIAVRIFQLDLFAARAHFHLISKMQSFLFELGNAGR